MAIKQKNLYNDDTSPGYRLVGVASTAALYLALENKSAAVEGDAWYDTTANILKTYDGTSWSAAGLNSNTAGSLDSAANIGVKITLDSSIGSGIELEATDAAIGTAGQLLLLDNNDTGNDVHSLEITHESTAPAVQFTLGADSTYEMAGSSTCWYMRGDGQLMARSLSLGDDLPIYLGDTARTGDVTIQFNDSVSLGTSGAGLLIQAVAADEQICIGSSTFAFDVYFSGESDFQNNMLWDMNGGINTVGALVFDNTDVVLGDDDAVVFGDGSDLIIQSGGGSMVLTTSTDNMTIQIGDGTKDFDLYWYAGTTSKYILFDQSGADVDIIDVDVGFDDSALLQLGSSDDIIFQFDSSCFLQTCLVADQPWKIGGTAYGFDITYYYEGSGDITTDYDAKVLAIDGSDLRIENDDYLLLGDDSTSSAQSIRWDSSGSTFEFIGLTQFESAVTMDGNLTVGGTLAVTGSWNPGAVGLGDNENLTFGDGSDFTIDYNSSADTLYVVGLSIFSKVLIGASSKPLDVTFTGSAANTVFDASADGFIVQDGGVVAFGTDSDIVFTGSSNNLTIAAGTANDKIWFGSGDTTYLDLVICHPGTTGADFWWDLSGSELFVGKDGKGWDCTWYAEQASDYMKWDQDANTNLGELIFEDSAIHLQDDTNIYFGDGRDWAVDSDGTNLIIQEGSAAGKGVHFGLTGTGCDVNFFGDNYNLTWDQGTDALFFADNAELGVGGSAGTHDLQLHSDGTTGVITGTVNLSILADSKAITFGGTGSTLNGTDVVFQSATKANIVKFDAAANTLTLSGIAQVFDSGAVAYTFSTSGTDSTYGTSSLAITATDNANAKIQFGLSGTNSIDLKWQAATSGENVIFDGGNGDVTFSRTDLIFAGTTINYVIETGTSDLLTIVDSTCNANAKIQFGISGDNSVDVAFHSMGSGQMMTWDAGASCALTLSGAALFMGASTDADTAYKIYQKDDVLMISGTADTSVNKIQFGISGTNSTDIVFQSMGSGQSVTFNAGASSLLTLSGIGLVICASSDTDTAYKVYQSGDTLMFGGTADTAVNKIQFGISGTNSTDIVFQSMGSGQSITFDAGASAALTLSGVALFMGASTDADTAYKVYQKDDTLMIGGTADTSVNKIQFGISSTNGTDIVFEAATSGSNITWDAGARTLTSSATGASFVGGGGTGVWEHAIIIPSGSAAPSTSIANGSGAMFYSHDASKIYVFTGSSWAGVAVAE